MKPNMLRVGRSAYYEHRATDKRYTERQRAELNLCLGSVTGRAKR